MRAAAALAVATLLWTRGLARATEECPGGVCPLLSPAAAAFSPERAYRDLVRQCEFGPRVPGTLAHEQCGRWLVRQLSATGAAVSTQRFTAEVGGRSLALTNIVAVINPRGQGHVLLCAHWDSRPRADRDPAPAKRGQPVPGANDGASGVAVLLEIARVLRQHPPRQQVTIVLFDGEDWGATEAEMLLGSREYARQFRGRPPDWAVLLDMVGDRDLSLRPERHSVQRAPGVVERVWGTAKRIGAAAFVRGRGPVVLDDHLPLLDRAIPCIDVIDLEYPWWHTTQDTPDKCAAASLGQVGRVVLEALFAQDP